MSSMEYDGDVRNQCYLKKKNYYSFIITIDTFRDGNVSKSSEYYIIEELLKWKKRKKHV